MTSGCVGGRGVEGGPAVGGGDDLPAVRAQVDRERARQRRLVVDDEHLARAHEAAARASVAVRRPGDATAPWSARRRGCPRRTGVPPIASVRPRATASPRPRPPALVSPSRWNGSNIRSRWSGGYAGAAVDDHAPRPSPGSTCASTRTGLPARDAHGVADQVGDDPLEQAGVGAAPAARTRRPRGDDARRLAGDGERQHLVEAAGAQHRVDQPALQPGQVEQVVDEPLELLGRRLPTARDQLAPVGSSETTRSEQPVDGGAHGGQRGAQVVGDRAQERGAGGLGALEGRRRARRARAAGGTPAPGRSARRTPRAPAGRWRAAARRTARARGRRRPGPGCRPRRASAARGAPLDGQHRPARRAARQQRDGVLAERLAEPLDDRLGGVLAGQHRAGQRAQRGRLGAGAGGLGGPARGAVDDGGDRRRDGDEDQQGQQVASARRS